MRPAAAASPGASLAIALPLPVLVATFCLLWSSAFSVTKLALADCPPLLLLTARFLVAGVVILGAAAVSGTTWCSLARRDLIVLAALGVANNALYLGLIYVGLRSISSGLSAIIVSTNPVLTALLAAVVLDERMTWRKAAGLALGIGGVAFIVESRIASGIDSPIGIMFTVAGLVSLVGGTILFKRLAPEGRLWIGNAVQARAVRLHLGEHSRGGAKLAPHRGPRLLRLARLHHRLSPLVPPAEHLRGHRGERVSLSDASARHAVRLAPDQRAHRFCRSHRHCPGGARYLSRDPPCGAGAKTSDADKASNATRVNLRGQRDAYWQRRRAYRRSERSWPD